MRPPCIPIHANGVCIFIYSIGDGQRSPNCCQGAALKSPPPNLYHPLPSDGPSQKLCVPACMHLYSGLRYSSASESSALAAP